MTTTSNEETKPYVAKKVKDLRPGDKIEALGGEFVVQPDKTTIVHSNTGKTKKLTREEPNREVTVVHDS